MRERKKKRVKNITDRHCLLDYSLFCNINSRAACIGLVQIEPTFRLIIKNKIHRIFDVKHVRDFS